MSLTDEVLETNNGFYAAIEAADVDRLEAVWDVTDDIVCVHLGWPAVVGRSRVLRSWAVIVANTAYLQFFPTEVEVGIDGDVAVVTCEHSLLARITDTEAGLGDTARVVSSNVYRRRDGAWRLWSHHASAVLADDSDGVEEAE
jgi:ketosteroid isomerase-like protein